MSVSIRRLGPGDEVILEMLAREDADFDLDGRSAGVLPLKPAQVKRYLSNPSVLHWIALKDGEVVGFLFCCHLLLRCAPGQELLLYEVGVRRAVRRAGVGRALLTHMEQWMRLNEVGQVWVCADNRVAVDFYRGCAFSSDDAQPVYMTRELELPPHRDVSTLLSVSE